MARMFARAVAWTALLAAAMGCTTTLDVQDHGVVFPTLRASKQLGDTWRIGVVADHGAGSDTQTLSGGEVIDIGGTRLSGNVRAEFDLTTVRLEGRARRELSSAFLAEGFFGAALNFLDVTATSGAARGHDTDFSAGPLVGGRIGFLPVPRLQLYLETHATYPIPGGIVLNGEVEAGVEYKAAGPVSLLAGWRYRNLSMIRSGSDFDFEWSGPFFGLAFDF